MKIITNAFNKTEPCAPTLQILSIKTADMLCLSGSPIKIAAANRILVWSNTNIPECTPGDLNFIGVGGKLYFINPAAWKD